MMEFWTFAVVVEFASQNGLHLFRLSSKEIPLATEEIDLNQIRTPRGTIVDEDTLEERQHAILDLSLCNSEQPS